MKKPPRFVDRLLPWFAPLAVSVLLVGYQYYHDTRGKLSDAEHLVIIQRVEAEEKVRERADANLESSLVPMAKKLDQVAKDTAEVKGMMKILLGEQRLGRALKSHDLPN